MPATSGAVHVAATRLRLETGARLVVFLHEWSLARDAFAQVRESGPGGAAHACEYETSLYLHLRPGSVQLEHAVSEPATAAVGGGLVDIFLGGPYGVALGRDFSRSGVLGDATLATAEKGRICFEEAVANLRASFRRSPGPRSDRGRTRASFPSRGNGIHRPALVAGDDAGVARELVVEDGIAGVDEERTAAEGRELRRRWRRS